ncbi:hypothetical protein ACFPES_28360 [Paenibacillus sp. GCM10023248]|uniref:hypothetical protein n=1 Tax=Bacillales TaxID=1385 RepID=UPI002379AAA9|nr:MULTISPECIES: hypothetical protein [Bacillales]MDD9270968.1 hypothetical protein [Paenibacillus sp. MAHUQ-63]MDR6882896.1 hypothetical protein [Bacillus sp. 3255]
MFPRFMKLALISFLCITALLGAHHYRTHPHDRQMAATPESWEAAKQGSPTFFQTNPFGMPGADAGLKKLDNMNQHAASYGLTPPTSMKALMVHTQETKDKHWSGWHYIGLLGLLGLLGLSSRRETSYSE